MVMTRKKAVYVFRTAVCGQSLSSSRIPVNLCAIRKVLNFVGDIFDENYDSRGLKKRYWSWNTQKFGIIKFFGGECEDHGAGPLGQIKPRRPWRGRDCLWRKLADGRSGLDETKEKNFRYREQKSSRSKKTTSFD